MCWFHSHGHVGRTPKRIALPGKNNGSACHGPKDDHFLRTKQVIQSGTTSMIILGMILIPGHCQIGGLLGPHFGLSLLTC